LKVRDRDARPAVLGFEWSASKARLNAEKHGVTFDEAATAFWDPLARIFDDPVHSSGEHRELLVGHSRRARFIIVSFAEHDDGRVRIISARQTTRRERREYEQGTR
jgi:uncharacterized protein